MNPVNWKCRDWVALIVRAVVGALAGTVIGFIVWSCHGENRVPFADWLKYPVDVDLYRGIDIQWWPWPVFGAVIAGLSFYAKKLDSN